MKAGSCNRPHTFSADYQGCRCSVGNDAMLDLKVAAGEIVFALRSAYTSPEGTCPFFKHGNPSFCMLMQTYGGLENPGVMCEGINYQNGFLCLRISQFFYEIALHIPTRGISQPENNIPPT